MEEHPHTIERVHLHIQSKSLCKERAQYIGRVAMIVGEKLYTWTHHMGGNSADVLSLFFAQKVCVNMEVDSLNSVGMLFHNALNFESLFELRSWF